MMSLHEMRRMKHEMRTHEMRIISGDGQFETASAAANDDDIGTFSLRRDRAFAGRLCRKGHARTSVTGFGFRLTTE